MAYKMKQSNGKQQCVQYWLSRKNKCDSGATSLAASEMGPAQGGAFLESPALAGCKSYNPAMMNDVDTFARDGQYFGRENCEDMAAQHLCSIFGLPGSEDSQTEATAPVEKGDEASKQNCFCSIVQGCTMQTLVHLDQRLPKG